MEQSGLDHLQVGLFETCSNLSCRKTISYDRSTEDISEAEKKYGLLCSKCRKLIKEYNCFVVECLYCGCLVSIDYHIKQIARAKKGYSLKCLRCGDYNNYDKNIITSTFQILIFKFLHKIDKWIARKPKNRKPWLMKKEYFERIVNDM